MKIADTSFNSDVITRQMRPANIVKNYILKW